MSLVKNIVLYGTMYATAVGLGYNKGYSVAQGQPTSLGLDLALIGGPIVGIGASAVFGSEEEKPMMSEKIARELGISPGDKIDIGTAIMLTFLLGSVSGPVSVISRAIGHGIYGGLGTLVSEGVGIGVGYFVGKN